MAVGIGLVGFGDWGPNLARNFRQCAGCSLVGICDQTEARRAGAGRLYPECQIVSTYQRLLDNPNINAIAVATPLATHFDLVRRALLAGKDVLVEKPLTRTVSEAEQLVNLARRTKRILAVDHTFLFTDAVRTIKELIDTGELGDLLYIDSVRTNLGRFRPDHNVIFDLAPHEISIVLHLVGRAPTFVQAQGACHTNNGIENLAYVHLEFDDGFIAHFHLNWLAPLKIRRTMVAGSRKMVVYDDMEHSDKVKVYDKGIVLPPTNDADSVENSAIDYWTGDPAVPHLLKKHQRPDAMKKAAIAYRVGDVVAPHLADQEPLAVLAAHFVHCVCHRKQPAVSGEDGMRVVRILEAAQRSVENGGRRVEIQPEECLAQLA